MTHPTSALVSLVAPMFNEENVIDLFFKEISILFESIDYDYEIVCVNDGSTDSTLNKLYDYAQSNEHIKVINLARNYGKEIALTAGLDYAIGDAVIPIDCDLQDPPEVIVSLLEKWKEGFDVVLAKRVDRSVDSLTKRWTSGLFYQLLAKISDIKIPQNVGDFRLLDRKAVDAICRFRERGRFMKGLFASLGFNEAVVEYTRASRAAGTTKWNYWKLYKLALEGIVSFTSMPLKIWSYVGASVSILAFTYGVFLIVKTLIWGIDVPGYASLMVAVLFMSGLILLCLGIIGEYVSRIFVEVKQRPIYLVRDTVGITESKIVK